MYCVKLFVRTNILCRKFSKCSINVKVCVFKSYCLYFYGTALWRCYKIRPINKLKSAYNKCMKIFFGYNRRYSVTQLLLELGLHSLVGVRWLQIASLCLSSHGWIVRTNLRLICICWVYKSVFMLTGYMFVYCVCCCSFSFSFLFSIFSP